MVVRAEYFPLRHTSSTMLTREKTGIDRQSRDRVRVAMFELEVNAVAESRE